MLSTHDDVVDRDEDQFDHVADESHDPKTYPARDSNFLELLRIWLCAPLHETAGIMTEFNGTLNGPAHGIVLVEQKRSILLRRIFSGR